MPKKKQLESVRLKNNFLKAREKYLDALRNTTWKNKKKRTIHDTARVLEGLKLQHKFIMAEKKRLERTIGMMGDRGKINPKMVNRLRKIKREDKESQERFKLIKGYFEREIKK
jgi:hypothetical protein